MKNIGVFGGILFVLGLAGIAEAVTGQGSFIVSAIVFAIGLGCSLAGLRGET